MTWDTISSWHYCFCCWQERCEEPKKCEKKITPLRIIRLEPKVRHRQNQNKNIYSVFHQF
jgi:hypothetical protein